MLRARSRHLHRAWALIGLLAAALATLAIPGTASALECAKAPTRVDQAICDTPLLRAAEADLTRFYFATLNALSGARHDLLTEDQRLWLTNREKECAGDVFCVAQSIASRHDELKVCYAGGPGAGSRCLFFLHRACPTMIGVGPPEMNDYPFLVELITTRFEADAESFGCIDDPETGLVATDNLQKRTITFLTERAGLVCIGHAAERFVAGAGHPNHYEALECYDTRTRQPLPFATVFPAATPGSGVLAAINAAVNGHLTTTCCYDNQTNEAEFSADLPDRPIGWAVDADGNPLIAYRYSLYGRSFMAYGPIPRETFINSIAEPFRPYFVSE